MFRKHSRIIAAVVVCFFTWTSGGVFSIAHAAQDAVKKGKIQEQQQKKVDAPEERFARVTGELESAIADLTADIDTKKKQLTAAKAEIETLDPAIRTQFAETEKKLKTAKLPAEILERHHKFVKHYDDNLAELKGNIERVEKAKDKKDAEAGIEKTRQHLAKVKTPSRHQKLDPNNLPHRQPVVKKREPRMKKEEFDQDLKKDKHAWKDQKRIQVASAGSLAGLLVSNSVNAIIPPTAADLAETVDVQLTPEIRAKALELGNNPVKIYEWVRNNVEFVPTWGSIQGAQMTMLTKQGNAFDTASLLIALLRAAGIHSRYVTGTVELPIATVMNWAGGFTDPMAALDFMSSGGVPTTALTEGGKVVKVRMEHVWVEAFINYMPSRGAKHINGKGDTWIKLDPSYKQYSYTNGIDIKAAVPFDAQAYLTQIQSTATIDATNGSVTGVNSLLTQQTMQDYQTRVQSYIQQNYPNATVGDVLGKKDIVKKEYSYLLGTLPYRTAVRGSTFTAVPDSLRHKLSFNVTKDAFDDTPISLTKSLPELAGKKITLSYSPATAQDEAIINAYLPKPHADGTPIQPSELPSSFPAYLINVKPELRVDGQVVATGAAIGLGSTENFVMNFYDPSTGDSLVTNTIDAGAYEAIGLNLGRISKDQITSLKAKLETTKTKLQNQDYSELSKDNLVGELLYTTALSYHAELSTMNFITAKTMGVNAITLPSETIFATKLKIDSIWGIPRSVGPSGLNMDADRLMQVVKALDGSIEKPRRYMLTTGLQTSALEHSVPEQLFSTPGSPVEGVSAVKALKIANDQGIPLYTVNQANITTILPQLQIAPEVKIDIQNAVNTGKVVTVSKSNITYNGWYGCGYIITNTETGAGAYMISGGLSGADLGGSSCDLCTPLFKTMVWLVASLISVVSIFFLSPVLGLFVTLVMPVIATIIIKSVCHDYTVTAKDVLLYIASVIGWIGIGAGVAATAAAGVSILLATTIMILMLLPLLLSDLISIHANYRKKYYKTA